MNPVPNKVQNVHSGYAPLRRLHLPLWAISMMTHNKHITLLILTILTCGYINGQGCGLEFYRVDKLYPDFTKVKKDSDCYYCYNPTRNDLIGDPIFTENDIKYFDWEYQQITLKKSSKYKLDSINIPLQGLAIAITIDKEPIYGLWFWNVVSSFGCDWVCTYPKLDFKINYGLPKTNENRLDPRFDSRLRDYIIENELDYKSPAELQIERAVKDSTIDSYYKEILSKGHLISHPDDNKMLSITDSLFSTHRDRQLFYFMVFTKSMNKSDGFYSEALGLNAMKFVNEHTDRFADYFNIVPLLNDDDFRNWIDYVWGEIMITAENHEKEEVEKLAIRLYDNIKGNRKEYKLIIDDFIEGLKTKSP